MQFTFWTAATSSSPQFRSPPSFSTKNERYLMNETDNNKNQYEDRKYQLECLEACKAAYDFGVMRQIFNIAPGGGKTVIFVQIAEKLGIKKKTLILVHRDFLAGQAMNKIRDFYPDKKVGVEMANSTSSPDDEIIICSVPTVGRSDRKRLSKFNPADIGLIISDECHHTTAPGWKGVLDYFGVLATQDNPHNILSVGVSATLHRLDGIQLIGNIYDQIVYEKQILSLIEEGYLTPPVAYRIETGVDISECRVSGADFAQAELDVYLNTEQRNQLILNGFKQFLDGIPTIGFCNSVQHCKDITELFNNNGIKSEYIIAETDTEDRESVFNRFRSKETKVIFNVGTLTEGLDLPICGGILYCKATMSWSLYYQSVTRCLRKFDGKEKSIIVDFYDSSEKHSLISAPTIFNLPSEMNCHGLDLVSVAKEIDLLLKQNPWFDPQSVRSLKEAQTVAREVYNLLDVRTFSNGGDHSSFFWHKMRDGSYRIQISYCLFVSIKRCSNVMDRYNLYKNKELKQSYLDLPKAFRIGDILVRALQPDASKLNLLRRKSGVWMNRAISAGQINLLTKQGMSLSKIKDLKRVSAQRLISKLIIDNALRYRKYID